MQKALTQMNVQLHHVVTDITGVTGMRIMRAIVAGERDPACWPPTATGAAMHLSKRSRQALIGNWRAEHLFALDTGAGALRLLPSRRWPTATRGSKRR